MLEVEGGGVTCLLPFWLKTDGPTTNSDHKLGPAHRTTSYYSQVPKRLRDTPHATTLALLGLYSLHHLHTGGPAGPGWQVLFLSPMHRSAA